MLKVYKNFYPDLFSWEEFENLINIRPLMNYERVHFSGKDDYEWDESYWALDNNCFPAHIIKDALYKGVCNFYDMLPNTNNVIFWSSVKSNTLLRSKTA